MQLFSRCGRLGIATIEASATDTVGNLKQQLCQRYPELGAPSELAVYYRGRVWSDCATLRRARMLPGATLDVQGPLRGGGGDGGSTGAESRSSYLEMYKQKKADKVDPSEEKLAKFTTCQLSGEPLQPPCVVDELGSLFNKDTVVKALVAKSLPKSLQHIIGLKSLLPLKLERNPNYGKSSTSGAIGAGAGNGIARSAANFQLRDEAQFCCPVSGVPLNGRYKFVALRPSGLVFSEKALKEARSAVLELTGSGWSPEDVLQLNPDGELLDKMKEKVLLKLAAAKAKKSAKRAAAGAGTAAAPNGTANGANGTDSAGGGAHGSAAAANGGGSVLEAELVPKPKKAKTAALPGPATDVYRSIFLDKSKQQKETYCCRSTSARGMNLT